MDPARLAPAVGLVGLRDPGPPIRVILAPEGSEGLARPVPGWVAGYAVSEAGVVVLLPGRLPAVPDSSLEDLLGHEVAHVLVSRAAGGRPVPRWFHEGMAMIAGGWWGLEERSRLTLALVRGREVAGRFEQLLPRRGGDRRLGLRGGGSLRPGPPAAARPGRPRRRPRRPRRRPAV